MRYSFRYRGPTDNESFLGREWLITNALGGYASGTILGVPTRRYHGMLIANIAAPWGRTMLVPRIDEELLCAGKKVPLRGYQSADETIVAPESSLTEFRFEKQTAIWTYQTEGITLEKRIVMPHFQNTVCVQYRLLQGDALEMHVRPYVTLRRHEGSLGTPRDWKFSVKITGHEYEIHPHEDKPFARWTIWPATGYFVSDAAWLENIMYLEEKIRGYDCIDSLHSPGYQVVSLKKNQPVTVVASSEIWEALRMDASEIFQAEQHRHEILLDLADWTQADETGQLVYAADQFIILPGSRLEEQIIARASGEELRSIVAGYHWFTDWGRDTMISLEGLTLATGRYREANAILRTFSHYIKNGLIPNNFPEGDNEAVYNTVDATLWYFHALDRYLQYTKDSETLHDLYPSLRSIIEHHIMGTLYAIHMDVSDGLIRAGAERYQLTWMDAKYKDWVVTPRRGKAVEIQALWYNSLRLMETWSREMNEPSEEYQRLAENVYVSFNQKFWYSSGGYLYDVIDSENGTDDSIRPNQIFALSMTHPVLSRDRWQPVFETVTRRLLTPFGLRTLSPDHKDYKPRYEGDLPTRDGAYHQGTVWAWLIGPYVDAYRKIHPDKTPLHLLDPLVQHLSEAGVGTVSEIFDAEPPHTPRGCIAQAWSVAELLRCLKAATAR